MLKYTAVMSMSRVKQPNWTYEKEGETHVFTSDSEYHGPYRVTPLQPDYYRLSWMGWAIQDHKCSRSEVTRELWTSELLEWLDRFAVPNEVRPEQFQTLQSKNGKRRWIEGQWCRLRRGKWVPIPKRWIGAVTYKETIMSRPSKQGGKRYRKHSRKRSEK